MIKRSVNERIEDGIELLKVVANSIIQNKMKKVPVNDPRRYDFYECLYCFECTRDQYLAIERQLDPNKYYRVRCFRSTATQDSSNFIWLDIKGDRDSNVYQRIRLRFETRNPGDKDGFLSIDIDDGAGFLGNKIYGTQIKSLLNKI